MQKILLATKNPNKINEIANPLMAFGLNIVLLSELGIQPIEETSLTFIENALLKARNASKISGLSVIAEDSGLLVDALCGAPGIISARYAGKFSTDQQNIKKLLHNLENVPDNLRQAQFYCVLVYLRYHLDPIPMVFQSNWLGQITRVPIGLGGFGYDSVFYIPTLGKTVAELNKNQKNTLSHRGQALKFLMNAFGQL